MSMTTPLKKPEILEHRRGAIIAKSALIQEYIKDQLASHVDTLTPPNGTPEITLCQ